MNTLREVQKDHEHLLNSVNCEVDLLRTLQQKIDVFERDRIQQSEQLADFMVRFDNLEQAFGSVKGRLAYLLHT